MKQQTALITVPHKATNKRGPKSKFFNITTHQYKFLVSKGFKDADIAKFLGITTVTLCNWKFKHKDFFNEIAEWKKHANITVERSLYERACGYETDAIKMMIVKGKIKHEKYVEHYPPDTEACKFWLKNKMPDVWKDKIDNTVNLGFTFKDLVERMNGATTQVNRVANVN